MSTWKIAIILVAQLLLYPSTLSTEVFLYIHDLLIRPESTKYLPRFYLLTSSLVYIVILLKIKKKTEYHETSFLFIKKFYLLKKTYGCPMF